MRARGMQGKGDAGEGRCRERGMPEERDAWGGGKEDISPHLFDLYSDLQTTIWLQMLIT